MGQEGAQEPGHGAQGLGKRRRRDLIGFPAGALPAFGLPLGLGRGRLGTLNSWTREHSYGTSLFSPLPSYLNWFSR